MRRAIKQGWGKLGGGGAARSAARGARLHWQAKGQGKARIEGKGKARIDEVVKKISKKAVKQKPPSGGAGGEASGRARPGPPQIAETACPPGSAADTAGEPPPRADRALAQCKPIVLLLRGWTLLQRSLRPSAAS